MNELYVHLFHILIVGSLFLYVGISGKSTPTFVFPILLALGIIIVLYHAYKTWARVQAQKNPWVNLLHVFLIGPLLIYIGLHRETTPRYAYEILLMLAFATIGYHGYYAVQAET